jgi:hypothetical protein
MSAGYATLTGRIRQFMLGLEDLSIFLERFPAADEAG